MPIRILKKDKNKSEPKKRFDPRTGEETNKPKPPRTIYAPKPQVPPERQMRTGGLSPKQKAIASKAPPPNKIDGKDFAVLKAEKAKGRGMGLQDESIKPGKVQKAFLGKMIKGVGRIFGRKKSATATPSATVSQKASLPINLVEEYKKAKGLKVGGTMKARVGKEIKADPTKPISSVKPNVGRYSSMQEMRAAKGFKPGETPAQFNKRKAAMEVAKKAAKATTIGKIVLPIAAAGVAGAAYLKNKLKKEDKKMGGGMMRRYSVGGGADLGKKGIIKGINAELQDKAERRLNVPDRTDIKKQKASVTKLKEQARRSRLETMKDRQTGRPVYERMGGGMMQRPMGYKSGTMVKARGCKLGRSKPTKMY